MVKLEQAQAEVDRNYEAFRLLLPQLITLHRGKWALLHDGKLTAVFDTSRDARVAGETFYSDAHFSIQEITMQPIDLGWFSHAGYQ